jgi:hypothetical protein
MTTDMSVNKSSEGSIFKVLWTDVLSSNFFVMCITQAQKLQMNVSFDAFLMDRSPTLTPKAQKLSMIRHFELDDDTKEYWGFYLLKGSEVSVSSCAR